MIPGSTGYQFPVRFAAVYPRGLARTARQEMHLNGALASPDSGTFQLLDAAGDAVLSGNVVVASSVATYPATVPTTTSFGKQFREVWTLVKDSVSYTVTRPAAVARYALEPTISQADITQSHKHVVARLGQTAEHLQDFIDNAWGKVLRRLWRFDQWPDAIFDTDQLHDVLEHQILVLLHELMAESPEDQHWAKMMLHKEQLADAWSAVTFRSDADQDGVADSSNRTSIAGTIHQNAPPAVPLPSWV